MDFSEYQTEIIEDIKSCLEGLQVQPILFMGAGVSQRYLKAPDWENLLKYLAETCPLITRPYGYYSQTRNDNKPMIASDFSESYAEWAWDVGHLVILNSISMEKALKIYISSMRLQHC